MSVPAPMTLARPPKLRRATLPMLMILALPLTIGCAAVKHAPPGCSPLFEDAMVTEVYFGLSGPGGRAIPKKDWQAFLKSDVVAAFPDGFTVIPAQGYWRGKGMNVTAQENSLVLKIIHPAGAAALKKLSGIAKSYARRFEQQAVLLSTVTTDAALCN